MIIRKASIELFKTNIKNDPNSVSYIFHMTVGNDPLLNLKTFELKNSFYRIGTLLPQSILETNRNVVYIHGIVRYTIILLIIES